jgi:hypothetical protein
LKQHPHETKNKPAKRQKTTIPKTVLAEYPVEVLGEGMFISGLIRPGSL